jgi:hypothetical protein
MPYRVSSSPFWPAWASQPWHMGGFEYKYRVLVRHVFIDQLTPLAQLQITW